MFSAIQIPYTKSCNINNLQCDIQYILYYYSRRLFTSNTVCANETDNSSDLIENQVLLSFSQQTATRAYPDPGESNP